MKEPKAREGCNARFVRRKAKFPKTGTAPAIMEKVRGFTLIKACGIHEPQRRARPAYFQDQQL
jgi:hypothetical protein